MSLTLTCVPRWSNVANLPRRKRDTDNVDVLTSLPFHLSLAMNLW